jgi:hypothetical protein
MKKQHLKTLAGTITDYAIAKKLISQVIGGITDPNDDDHAPSRNTGSPSGTSNDETSQGRNSSTGN